MTKAPFFMLLVGLSALMFGYFSIFFLLLSFPGRGIITIQADGVAYCDYQKRTTLYRWSDIESIFPYYQITGLYGGGASKAIISFYLKPPSKKPVHIPGIAYHDFNTGESIIDLLNQHLQAYRTGNEQTKVVADEPIKTYSNNLESNGWSTLKVYGTFIAVFFAFGAFLITLHWFYGTVNIRIKNETLKPLKNVTVRIYPDILPSRKEFFSLGTVYNFKDVGLPIERGHIQLSYLDSNNNPRCYIFQRQHCIWRGKDTFTVDSRHRIHATIYGPCYLDKSTKVQDQVEVAICKYGEKIKDPYQLKYSLSQ